MLLVESSERHTEEPSVLVVLAGFGCLMVQLHDAHAPDEGVHTYTHESNYSSTRLPACPAGVSLSWAWMAA